MHLGLSKDFLGHYSLWLGFDKDMGVYTTTVQIMLYDKGEWETLLYVEINPEDRILW